ncbi:MAG: hypothetical protein EB121_04295, partial [Alphaproteobacteria bacterium]|nr:hypothetical protein [Alphaproteobacteria bacterium]
MTWLQPFHLTMMLLAAMLMLWAAISDVRHFRIPNMLNGALLALFPLFVLSSPQTMNWPQHVLVFTLVLVVGLYLFSSNLAGAGDVKFLAVLSLWAGPQTVVVLMMVTALGGGVLAVLVGLRHWMTCRKSGEKFMLGPVMREPIPYGVAIAAGGMVSLGLLSRPL